RYRLEALRYLRSVAGDDQLGGSGEPIDRVEGCQHLRQARDDLHGLPGLDVVIEVRGIRREHHGAAPGLDADDLQSGRVAADSVNADTRPHLVVTLDDRSEEHTSELQSRGHL